MTDIVKLFGDRCPDYDPDCAGCFAWKQHDKIEQLQRENERLQKVNVLQVKWLYEEQQAHKHLREKVAKWLKEKE